MSEKNVPLTPVDIQKIKFDSYGRYEVIELTEAELMDISGGKGWLNPFINNTINIGVCPINNGCNPPPPPPPPPPPQAGEDTDGE